MSNIKIIDNFLDPVEFEQISKYALGMKFPWFYVDTVSLPPNEGSLITDPMAVETAGLNHVMYDEQWDVRSFAYDAFVPFFRTMEQKLALKERDVIRARASLKWPKVGYTKDNYCLPHVDYYYPHETLIYYLNDSDGDTFIFNEHFVPSTGDTYGDIPRHYTIQERVKPTANRLIWIDGLHFHTASNPIDSDKRVILNINLRKRYDS